MINSIRKAASFTKQKLLVEIRKLEALIRNDPFDGLAAELQDVLLLGWNKAQQEAINEAIRKLSHAPGSQLDLFTESDLNRLLPELRIILGDKFAGDVAADIEQIILNTYAAGLTGSVAVKPTFNIIDTQAINFLQQHNVYWVKHYFDNQLQDKVVDFGTRIIEKGFNRAEAGKLFENEFAKKYQSYSWRYWQGFANHVVTRSREFGNVERYVRAGIEYLQVKAVNDHRTTEICRHMHNRVIKVSKAVELRDQLIAAETPEEVKEIAPWMKPDKLAAKPSKSLPAGMSLPPYHFNCRSRTVKASSSAVEEQIKYEKNVKQLHKNADYKQNYKDYRELGTDAPVHRSLRFDENVAIWSYTRDLYYDVNRALYSDLKLSAFQKSYANVLDKSLSKIPRTKNSFLRGISLNQSQIDDILSSKQYRLKSFNSSSISSPFKHRNVIFVMEGKAHKVSNLSFYPNEDEYLFRPGTTFDILKSEKKNKKWYIHLLQTDFKSMFEKTEKRSFEEAVEFHEEQLKKLNELEGKEREAMAETMQHIDEHVNPGGTSFLDDLIK